MLYVHTIHNIPNIDLNLKQDVHLRPYSQTQSSWSMIRGFSNDDIFIVIFTSSGSNNHDEQICSLIGPASTNLANRIKQIFK
jgi:hypothetical protein